MSHGTAVTRDSRSSIDAAGSRGTCAGLVGSISTALVSILILARSVSFIDVGPVANLERLLVPLLLYWGIVFVLLERRLSIPWAFLLLLAPGLVLALAHRQLDPGLVLFPLVAITVFLLPIRWRPVAMSVGILVTITFLMLVAGWLMGADYRGGGRNGGLPWLLRDLTRIINVPGRTLVLSLPLILVTYQRQGIGRRGAGILICMAMIGILLTGSRANMVAAGGFLLVVYALKGGERNWFVVTMTVCIGVISIGAFLVSGREVTQRWSAVSRIGNEISMLVQEKEPPQEPLARSIVTASAIAVIRDEWLIGHGNSHDLAARAWADERALVIQRQVKRKGAWHLHIHGSFFVIAARTGIPALLVFLGGLCLLAIRSIRCQGLSGSNVVLATLVLVTISQLGGDTLSKVFCLVVLGVVFKAADRPVLDPRS